MISNSVKPVYKGHSREPENEAFISPFYIYIYIYILQVQIICTIHYENTRQVHFNIIFEGDTF